MIQDEMDQTLKVICAVGRHQIKLNIVHAKTIMAVKDKLTS